MIHSMTGFAQGVGDGEWGELVVELRAVNHRFLDIKIALPESLRALEADIRESVRSHLTRGRIEVALYWRPPKSGGLRVDEDLGVSVIQAARRLAEASGGSIPAAADALSVMRWPGVVESPSGAPQAMALALSSLLEETLDRLIGARAREGAALAAALGERLDRMGEIVAALREHVASAEQTIRSRLETRLAALGEKVDEGRIAQEAALLVVRQDPSEELDRLAAHTDEVRRLLTAEAAVGRRLDFLMQELAREANTLAAKAGNMEISRLALDCKVVVEEMREQVQNVE